MIEVISPVAVIHPSGTVSFCKDNSNELIAYAGPGYQYQWYRNDVPIPDAADSVYSVQESGSYSAKVSAIGCESVSAPVVALVNPSPETMITLSGSSSFCEGKNVTLFASSNAGYFYQWYKNNVPIPGATGSSYTATTGGNYTVLTTLGNCSRASAPVTLIVLDTPMITINPVTSVIRKFQTQTLNASGANAYNWVMLPDVVSYTSNSAVVRPLSSMQYVIEGVSNNSCKASATAFITVTGCGDVTDISAINLSPSRVLIRWKNPEGTSTDSLRYRKTGTTNWNNIFVSGEEYELNQLEPGTDYEYNIIPLCATTDGISSSTKTFRTATLENDLFIQLLPNPVSSSSTRIEIILNQPYSLQLLLYDSYGRMITQISRAENIAGGQVMKQVNTTALASGVYYVVAFINNHRYVMKMVVIR